MSTPNTPRRNWKCINPAHTSPATWDGEVATCPVCGCTNEMTRQYARELRARWADRILAQQHYADGEQPQWTDPGQAYRAGLTTAAWIVDPTRTSG